MYSTLPSLTFNFPLFLTIFTKIALIEITCISQYQGQRTDFITGISDTLISNKPLVSHFIDIVSNVAINKMASDECVLTRS